MKSSLQHFLEAIQKIDDEDSQRMSAFYFLNGYYARSLDLDTLTPEQATIALTEAQGWLDLLESYYHKERVRSASAETL